MSISSIAQESALRLSPAAVPRHQRDKIIAARAATATVAAMNNGSPPDAAAAATAGAAEGAGEPPPASTDSNVLTQLVKYIPTESITLYVAITAAVGEVKLPKSGKLSDADFTGRWWLLAAMVAVTVLMTVGLSYRAQKNLDAAADYRLPYFDVTAAAVAFAVWGLALPTTPLSGFASYDYSVWNSVVLLIGTTVISFGAYVLGKNVSWEKVLT